jgi:hypothetical protein
MCTGRTATPETSLAGVAPDVAIEWHPTKNGTLRPEAVTAGSQRLVWWRCSKDAKHEWQARVAHRANGSGCPMCANLVATALTSLRAQCPALAREWHPTKNGTLTPDDVVPGSGRRVWWRCGLNRHHVWEAVIYERARKGRGCPVCRGADANARRKRRRPPLRGPTLT